MGATIHLRHQTGDRIVVDTDGVCMLTKVNQITTNSATQVVNLIGLLKPTRFVAGDVVGRGLLKPLVGKKHGGRRRKLVFSAFPQLNLFRNQARPLGTQSFAEISNDFYEVSASFTRLLTFEKPP